MHRRRAWALAGLLILAACGGSSTPIPPISPTPPGPPASPSGTWSGTLKDPVAGEGSLELSLAPDSRGGFSGTWSVTFGNGDRFAGPAAAALVVSNSYGMTLYVDPQPLCSGTGGVGGDLLGFSLVNTVITATRLTAVAGRLACSGPGLAFGSVDLSKPAQT
jgi:hypothetical protein